MHMPNVTYIMYARNKTSNKKVIASSEGMHFKEAHLKIRLLNHKLLPQSINKKQMILYKFKIGW